MMLHSENCCMLHTYHFDMHNHVTDGGVGGEIHMTGNSKRNLVSSYHENTPIVHIGMHKTPIQVTYQYLYSVRYYLLCIINHTVLLSSVHKFLDELSSPHWGSISKCCHCTTQCVDYWSWMCAGH